MIWGSARATPFRVTPENFGFFSNKQWGHCWGKALLTLHCWFSGILRRKHQVILCEFCKLVSSASICTVNCHICVAICIWHFASSFPLRMLSRKEIGAILFFIPFDGLALTSWQSHVLDLWCTAMFVDALVVLQSPLPKKSFDHNFLAGCRVGEAKNPGPNKTVATFAIINPTSLHQKLDDFLQLKKDYDIDVFACSETSATEQIQQQFTHQMRQHGYFSQWSAPVQPQRLRLDLIPSKRGKAGGTSLHSCFPSRLCCNPPPNELIASNRIVHSILRIGALHIQTFVIYGMTGSVAGHVEFSPTTSSIMLFKCRRNLTYLLYSWVISTLMSINLRAIKP